MLYGPGVPLLGDSWVPAPTTRTVSDGLGSEDADGCG